MHQQMTNNTESDELRRVFLTNLLSEVDSDPKFLDNMLNDKTEELLPQWFYKFIISFVTNLELSDDEAHHHFINIIRHRETLSKNMDSKIDFRVASLDYFLNVTGMLSNPMFTETSFFEQIYAYSKEDPKTGCYNSRFFKEFTQREINRAARHDQTLSVILLDIDNFKTVNDRFGHLYGDKVIMKFAKSINEHVREEDIFARYGGDEFAVLMPQTGRIGARSMGERLKETLKESFENEYFDNTKVNVTFSAGIATYPFDAKDYDSLIDFADKGIYRSKFLGKNQIFDQLESDFQIQQQSGKERRKSPRYSINAENIIQFLDKDKLVNLTAKVIDISQFGVQLECKCALKPEIISEYFEVRMKKLGKHSLDAVLLGGKSIRVNHDSAHFTFSIALQFDNPLETAVWNTIKKFGKISLA